MNIDKNYSILLLVMVLSIAVAYLVAYYLPSQGINIITFGQSAESILAAGTGNTLLCDAALSSRNCPTATGNCPGNNCYYNTCECTVSSSQSIDSGYMYTFDSLTINSGVTISFVNTAGAGSNGGGILGGRGGNGASCSGHSGGSGGGNAGGGGSGASCGYNPGAGGSNGGSYSGGGASSRFYGGGSGGGIIKINLSSYFINDGTINAAGGNGGGGHYGGGGGGGGGYVQINASSFNNRGTISAGGGGGGWCCGASGSSGAGGGGGGGYVQINVISVNNNGIIKNRGTISATGGGGGDGYSTYNGHDGSPGSAGTINITILNYSTTTTTTTSSTTSTTTTQPPGCARNTPTITVNPESVNAKLGDTFNFTSNVTNTDSSECGNTTFVFNGSQEKFTFLNITADLFNFTANPNMFNLTPGNSQIVNFSYGSNFIFANNYSLNVTASDVNNISHSGTAFLTYNVSESIFPLYFKCNSITNGHRCDFGFISNYLQDLTVLFLVSNSRGKVVSSGGATTIMAGLLTFNFYCSTFGPGAYTISWFAYKGSDVNLTKPISYSTTLEDIILNC